MRALRRRLTLSITMIWLLVYITLIVVTFLGLLYLLHIGKIHSISNYSKELLIFFFCLFLCFLLSLVVSYGIAWIYIQDEPIFYENKLRSRGFFYEFDEVKSIKIHRFLWISFMKIYVENEKPILLFKKNKKELLDTLKKYHLNEFISNAEL